MSKIEMEKGEKMKHKFNLYYDLIYPILCKVVGKTYGCCDKIRNCKRCCKRNGWKYERSD